MTQQQQRQEAEAEVHEHSAACFGVERRAGPLICAHFLHYNAWGIANIPFNYVVNAVVCAAHTEKACSASLQWIGVLTFVSPCVQFCFAKTAADLSDAHGRKPFLLIACIAIFLFGLLFATADSSMALLVANTLNGIFAVGYSTGQAYLADVTTNANGEATENRAVTMAAYYGITQGLTAVCGTLAALVLMKVFDWSAKQTFWVIAVLAILEVPCILFGVGESLTVQRRKPYNSSKGNPLGVIKDIFGRNPFFSRLMYSKALSQCGAIFLSSTWVNFLDVSLGWGVVGSSATIMLYGGGLAFIPTWMITKFGELPAIQWGYFILILTYLYLAVLGPYAAITGECRTPDGQPVPGPSVVSIDDCRSLPAAWGMGFASGEVKGCSDGISLNSTACATLYLSPPEGYENGLSWESPLWLQVSLFIAPIFYCTGFMYDAAQSSYISKQVAADEQGALQGTLLSLSLLTTGVAAFLSNASFSFFISDVWIDAVGFKWAGGQFVVSAICFLIALINLRKAFSDPEIAKYDVVRSASATLEYEECNVDSNGRRIGNPMMGSLRAGLVSESDSTILKGRASNALDLASHGPKPSQPQNHTI